MSDRPLTDAEINKIAELAADKAYQRFYQVVGKNVVKKAVWIIGAGIGAIWFFIETGTMPK